MYKISQENLQAILHYLVNQPYKDVYQLVNLIQSVEKMEE